MTTRGTRILDETVVEIVNIPEGLTLADLYHPDTGFIECTDDAVNVGWYYADGAFYAVRAEPQA